MQLQNVILVVPLLFQATFASPTAQHVDERSTSSQPLCGVVGYDCGKYVLNKAQCSVAQCEALCKKNSKCKSYGYGQNTCRLYSAAVKDNVTRKSGSPYKFYDRACPCPSSVTAPRTTTSAKQATTTSSMTSPKTSTTSTKTSTTSIKTSTTSTKTSTASTTATTAATTTASSSTTTTTASTTTPAVPSNKCMPIFDGSFENVQDSNLNRVGAQDGPWRLTNAYFATYPADNDDHAPEDTKYVTFSSVGSSGTAVQTLNGLQGGTYSLSYNYWVPSFTAGSCTYVVTYAAVEIDRFTLDAATYEATGFLTRMPNAGAGVQLPAGTSDISFSADCTLATVSPNLDSIFLSWRSDQCQSTPK